MQCNNLFRSCRNKTGSFNRREIKSQNLMKSVVFVKGSQVLLNQRPFIRFKSWCTREWRLTQLHTCWLPRPGGKHSNAISVTAPVRKKHSYLWFLAQPLISSHNSQAVKAATWRKSASCSLCLLSLFVAVAILPSPALPLLKVDDKWWTFRQLIVFCFTYIEKKERKVKEKCLFSRCFSAIAFIINNDAENWAIHS